MTMLVRVTGGRDARIEAPFMVFQNKARNYPIRGVTDDVPGVCYRTCPKGWMDSIVLSQYFREPRAIKRLPRNRKRVIYVDNCSSHTNTDDLEKALADINTELRYLPKNSTNLVQPCDSFIIQKIKSAWSRRWEAHKISLRKYGTWSDSGKLPNPGKCFFLQLATNAVREVNLQGDENGISYARKAMIRCGMSLNLNGNWEVPQLFPKLQNIVRKYRNHSDGEPVYVQEGADGCEEALGVGQGEEAANTA